MGLPLAFGLMPRFQSKCHSEHEHGWDSQCGDGASPDIGGSRASCAMIAAEVLGLAAEDIHPVVADTESIGHTDTTGGSRVTFATGLAVYEAAQDAVGQLKQRAATVWKVKPEEVVYQDGALSCTNNGHESMDLKELAPKFPRAGGPVMGRASVRPRGVGPRLCRPCR